MQLKEKINLLAHYESITNLKSKHLKEILYFSKDKNAFVRSRAAALLVNFTNKNAKAALLKLARDKDTLVRIEAYDSLAVFEEKEVMDFLKTSIKQEKNKMACSYAILSWADIVATLNYELCESKLFVKKLKSTSRMRASERCILSCCYAQYILGEKEQLNKIVSFMNSKNYQIRCAALNLMEDISNCDNKVFIKEQIEKLLSIEKTVAVITTAERVLSRI